MQIIYNNNNVCATCILDFSDYIIDFSD